MFEAYTTNGAPTQLHMLPPFGANGHLLLLRAPVDTWLPAVERFLAAQNLPSLLVIALPLPPALPAPPGLLPVCQNIFARYVAFKSDAKAFATTPLGGCGFAAGRTVDEARERAIVDCEAHTHAADCKLYAVGQHVAEK
jgi:hypothetical protein